MGQIKDRPDSALAARLDPVVDAALAEGRVARAVVLVGRQGERAYARAAGKSDLEGGRDMTLDTIFRASSLTKPMVTAAAPSLAEDGIVRLDDPVTRYLPDFQPKWDGQVPTITLRQLLTHTAGLSYGFMQPNDGPYLKLGVSDGMDQPGLGFPEELKRITEAGLFFPPGAAWLYSVGLDVLGAAVEEATGRTLGQVVADRVTGKLGMADTGYAVSDRSRLAKAYADGPPPKPMGDAYVVPFAELSGIRFAPDRIFDPGSFPSGGAGMVGSAGDFMRLLETLRSGGSPLLAQELVNEMGRNHTGTLGPADAPGYGFGLGFSVLHDPAAAASPESAGTWRWGGAYGHAWFVDRARELSVVAFTNTLYEGMSGRFVADLRDAVYA